VQVKVYVVQAAIRASIYQARQLDNSVKMGARHSVPAKPVVAWGNTGTTNPEIVAETKRKLLCT
jgi:hypothetical protein